MNRSLKQTPSTAKAKILNKHPDLAVDWKKLHSLAFETTLDTKLREFQYKILNLIIFTNGKLHRFKMVDSRLCAFCNAEEESLEHLLYFCKASTFFWKELLSWIAVEANIVLNASLLDILFGKFDLEKDFLLVNHILLLAKYFIYKCKLSKVIPLLLVFKAKLKATYKVELYILQKRREFYQIITKSGITFSLGCLDVLHIFVHVTFFFLWLFLFHSYYSH